MLSRPALPLVLLVTTTTLAGCLAGLDDNGDADVDTSIEFPADWWVDVIPSSLTDEEHDHNNRSHHQGLTTPNFETIGWDPLITSEFGTTLTGMGCGGAENREDGRRLAVVHSISTTVSFVVADITDPENPEMLGEFYLPNAVVWDATISADGQHVLIGAYPPIPLWRGAIATPVGDIPYPDPPTAPVWAQGIDSMIVFRNSCTGEVTEVGPANYLPGPAIVMAGIQDPTEPTFEDYKSQPVIGPHSVGSQMVDGITYATSSVTNLAHEGSYYTFYQIADTPAGSRLVELSMLQTPGTATADWAAAGGVWLNGHTDVYIHKHPFTGQVLAYLANGDGMYVYDLSIPQLPQQLAVWRDGFAGAVHTTYPFPYADNDTFYMVVAQEVGEPAELPSGYAYILDVTDPADPTEVSRWTLPLKPKWDSGGLQFSPHYVAVLDDTLFVTNYHGGMWAVDISDLTDPESIGIFVPHLDSPESYGGRSYGPAVGDVIVDQETGLITVWDNAGGVYQLRFDETMDAPRAPAWGTPENEAARAQAGHI